MGEKDCFSTGLYIRKVAGSVDKDTAHTGTFGDTATIIPTTAAKFEPCTSATSTTSTTDDGTITTVTPNKFNAFKPSFAKLSKVETSSLTYTMLGTDGACTNITDTDVYGVADTGKTLGDNTKAYYYNFKIDYMITTGKSLNIGVENVKLYDEKGVVISGKYAKDEYYYETKDGVKTKTQATEAATVTAGVDEAFLDKATRVAFLDAESYSDADGTDKVTYAGTGKEYAIASTTTTDHNLNALKELGYTGDSEYKYDTGMTVLDATTNFHKVTTPTGTTENPTKTTSDGSFTYGSVDVYVWFDGTDKACTNAIFSQKVTFDLTFTITR